MPSITNTMLVHGHRRGCSASRQRHQDLNGLDSSASAALGGRRKHRGRHLARNDVSRLRSTSLGTTGHHTVRRPGDIVPSRHPSCLYKRPVSGTFVNVSCFLSVSAVTLRGPRIQRPSHHQHPRWQRRHQCSVWRAERPHLTIDGAPNYTSPAATAPTSDRRRLSITSSPRSLSHFAATLVPATTLSRSRATPRPLSRPGLEPIRSCSKRL